MSRHHAHAGNHLVMALGAIVVLVCGVVYAVGLSLLGVIA